MAGWAPYFAAAAGLVASHALLSAPRLRARALAHLGRAGFHAVYSIISTAALALFVWAYLGATPGPQLFVPADGVRPGALVLMPVALFAVVCRLTTSLAAAAHGPARGIYRITRAPGSLGILLWAALHLANTGDGRRLVLFATMAAIALIAMAKNELVLAREGSDAAAARRRATSLVPFAAIAAGRQRLAPGEIGWWRTAAALALYGALLAAHPVLFGPDPLAGVMR